jgi:hypothetical protein
MKWKRNKTARQQSKIAKFRARNQTQRRRNINRATRRMKKESMRQLENATFNTPISRAKTIRAQLQRNKVRVRLDGQEVDPTYLLKPMSYFSKLEILFTGEKMLEDAYLIFLTREESFYNNYNNSYDQAEYIEIYRAKPYTYFLPSHGDITVWYYNQEKIPKSWKHIFSTDFSDDEVYTYLSYMHPKIIELLEKPMKNKEKANELFRWKTLKKYKNFQQSLPEEILKNQEKKLGKSFGNLPEKTIRRFLGPEVSSVPYYMPNMKKINTTLFQ